MEKIKNLQKALHDLGVKSTLVPVTSAFCTDGKWHIGMELKLSLFDGEGEPYTFIFTPTGQFVEDWLQCPIDSQKEKIKNQKKSKNHLKMLDKSNQM